jgi:integrase
MLERRRKLKSGKIWVGYYYNGRGPNGERQEISLGTDLAAAKRKWAELEGAKPPEDATLMRHAFDQYTKQILSQKAVSTQKEYLDCINHLRPVFDDAPINAIRPSDIARYRDARSAKVRANREIAVFSLIFNLAREWGYTTNENPCKGVRKNKEDPRDYYAEKDVWEAVREAAVQELRDAMDLGYLTGQRPGDVLKMRNEHVRDGELFVQQKKRGKKLRIQLRHGRKLTQLGRLLEEFESRPVQCRSGHLLCTPAGVALSPKMLRIRFDTARAIAATEAEVAGLDDLAARIRAFQFRDIRPKAASEIDNLDDASNLLGHTNKAITKRVYRRAGERVKPTK